MEGGGMIGPEMEAEAPGGLGPKKKKYAKEAWPGKKPAFSKAQVEALPCSATVNVAGPPGSLATPLNGREQLRLRG